MTESKATDLLSPYFDKLRAIVIDGFKDYTKEYAHVSHKHHARSRACLIHDHIAHYARERLLGIKDFHQIPTKIRNLFDVKGELVLQFKKLTRKLRTSNIRTQLSFNFDGQMAVHELPGIPSRLPKLSLGYVPRRDWTDIDGVFLTYSVGKRLNWFISLTDASEQPEIFPATIPNEPQPQISTTRRVRAKSPRRKQSGDAIAGI
jgi:hypothetical protein